MFITFLGLLKMSSKLETCCGFCIEYLAKNLERKILAFTQRGHTYMYHMLIRILFVIAKISAHFHWIFVFCFFKIEKKGHGTVKKGMAQLKRAWLSTMLVWCGCWYWTWLIGVTLIFPFCYLQDCEFHGVVRFYFQDGSNVVTKCIRMASTATTKEVVNVLVEKFRPDMRMLTANKYALHEVHSNGGTYKLLNSGVTGSKYCRFWSMLHNS